jgi:hypothetical protein
MNREYFFGFLTGLSIGLFMWAIAAIAIAQAG